MDIGGPFCKVEFQQINLNSFTQVKDYLLSQGWKPTEYTEAGSPKLTEDSFDSVSGEIPQLIARRSVLMHRKRMLSSVKKNGEDGGLLNMVRGDGRIEARAITNATSTGRMVHSQIVNIPASGAVYGEEFRSLFIVPDGYVMGDIDAQALEARCMSHYLLNYKDGDKIADILLNQDVHQVNADLWGCTRKEAKSPFYALNFGAQPKKLAETMGCDLKRAKKIYDDFWGFYKPLQLFKNDLVKVWKQRGGNGKGFVRGLDGRKLFARSEHSLVNLIIQSTGSIYIKTAGCYIDNQIAKHNLDVRQIIVMHDEYAYEVREDLQDVFKEIAEGSFKKAGEFWKIRVPMVGEMKYAKNWAGCH